MRPKSAHAKGKELERWWRDQMRTVYPEAEVIGKEKMRKSDVRFGEYISECKNTKKFDWKSAADQVRRDSLGYSKESIIWHPPQRPLDDSIAIIPALELKRLLEIEKNSRGREEILDKWQIKNNLEKAVYHLKKVIKEI